MEGEGYEGEVDVDATFSRAHDANGAALGTRASLQRRRYVAFTKIFRTFGVGADRMNTERAVFCDRRQGQHCRK